MVVVNNEFEIQHNWALSRQFPPLCRLHLHKAGHCVTAQHLLVLSWLGRSFKQSGPLVLGVRVGAATEPSCRFTPTRDDHSLSYRPIPAPKTTEQGLCFPRIVKNSAPRGSGVTKTSKQKCHGINNTQLADTYRPQILFATGRSLKVWRDISYTLIQTLEYDLSTHTHNPIITFQLAVSLRCQNTNSLSANRE